MKRIKLTPRWRIQIRRPYWNTAGAIPAASGQSFEEKLFEFSSDAIAFSKASDPYQNPPTFSGYPVVAFEYETALENPETGFSITFVPADDFITKIELRDLVYFYDETYGPTSQPDFVGIVKDRRYSARMGDAPVRHIVISGQFLASLVTGFNFILDLRIFTSAFSDALNRQLMTDLQAQIAKGSGYSEIAAQIVKSFVGILKDLLGTNSAMVQFFSSRFKISSYNATSRYPKVMNFYQAGDNNLWTILQNLTDRPWNETFWTLDGENLLLVIRDNPFKTENWSVLPVTAIAAEYLTGIDLGNSDQEAFTVFATTFPGSGVDLQKAMVVSEYREGVKRSPLLAKYGYKALSIERHFMDRSRENTAALVELMKSSSQELLELYQNLPDMLSGTLVCLPMPKTPRIGEKISLNGNSEFYVESISRSWSYLSPFETTLKVTRGAQYDTRSGAFVSPVRDLARRSA